MNYSVLRSFINKFDSFGKTEQEAITLTIQNTKDYLETNQAQYGLRIKRLSPTLKDESASPPEIYEARINIHLRIAYFRDKDTVKFFCLGNHDDIKRCLKNLKRFP